RRVQPAPARARHEPFVLLPRAVEFRSLCDMSAARLRRRSGDRGHRFRLNRQPGARRRHAPWRHSNVRLVIPRGGSMSNPAVYPLFSTPVYVNNVGDFAKPDVTSLEYSSSLPTGAYNFLSSTDKRVLDRPEFDAVRAIVTRELELYTRQVLAVSRSIEFYITDSWVNIYRRGQAAGPHVHNNSLISGVLYLKVPENGGDIVFHRPVLSLVPFPPALDLDIDAFNIYNCKSWGYTPKT